MRMVLIGVCVLALWAAGPVSASYDLGDTVEDFTLLDTQGQPVHLYDFQGQVILLNFFATWCPPCNEEAPVLEQDFWQEYQAAGFTVLAVDLLEQDWVVADWVEELGLTYPTVLAPDWDVFRSYPQAGGIPYNAVIDQDLMLRYSQYGFDHEELTELVEDLLGLNPVPAAGSSLGAIKALFR